VETSSSQALIPRSISALTVDEQIASMANERLSDVVMMSEGMRPRIGPDSHSQASAATYLVCRLFTDAIFSEDIRAIQLIINRVDGGLPKDVEVDDYQTQFSDCLNEIMAVTDGSQLKVLPDDTVMMALCKALYALATQDIYWDSDRGRMRRPSVDKKQERDAALRMVLERTGGRKTLVVASQSKEEVEEADWISMLPGV
jgi:hypothetical protein